MGRKNAVERAAVERASRFFYLCLLLKLCPGGVVVRDDEEALVGVLASLLEAISCELERLISATSR